MIVKRLAGDVLHHQVGRALLVDSHVVQLDDRRMGELTDDLRFVEELLLQAITETAQKGFQGDDAAQEVVPRFFDATRGTGTELSEKFVAVFLRGDHHAERKRRAARSRRPLPLVCGAACGMTLRRASG